MKNYFNFNTMKDNYISMNTIFTKKKYTAFIKIMLMAIILLASSVFNDLSAAGVVITAPSLSDTATCQFPTPYSALGDIVITETATTDFAVQTSKTLILNAPPNFSFNPGIGNVSGISADITVLSIAVAASKITITMTVAATGVMDVITISNIQVHGTNNPSGPSTVNRSALSTATINGDITNTPHATLTSIARDPNITVQPSDQSPCEFTSAQFGVSTIISPEASYQWQEDQGGGFVNLANAPPYSNVNTFQVTIANVPSSMSGYQYRCIVTGADDICTSLSAFLTVKTAPVITSDPTNKTVCEGGNTSFSVTATGTGLTYSWLVSTDAGFSFNPVILAPPYSAGGNVLFISNTPAGFDTYQYQCTVGGTCDPQPVTSITAGKLKVNPKPVVITVFDTACSPATFNITLPGVTAGSTPAGLAYTYFSDSTATTSYPTPTVASGGKYYIVGKIVATGCADTTALIETANPKPVLVTHDPAAVCGPEKVDITLPADTAGSTGGLTLSYYTDAAATIGYATPTAADSGTYYIVGVLPATGCSDTTAITVTVNPKPTVITVNQTVCSPSTADLTAIGVTSGSTPGLTFKVYSDAAATFLYPTPSAAVANTYYIVGTVPVTLCSDTTMVLVTVNPKPTLVTTNPAAVCAPGTIDLTVPADTAGSTASLTLNYYTDAGATTHIPDSSAVSSSGIYYIVGMTGLGCSDTTAITVTVNPKPVLTITNPAVVCAPATIDITLPADTIGSTAGLTLSYFTDAGATTPVADSSAIAISGTYYIVGVLPATGCSDTAAIVVTVNPKPILVTNNPPAVCSPATIDLTMPADTTGSTGNLTLNYFMDAGATVHVADSSAVSASGTYYIVGVIAGGCSDTAAITVTINPKPTLVTNNPTTVCAPAIVDLTLPAITAGSTPGLTLSYFSDAAATVIMADSSNVLLSGTYYIVGVSGSGCSDTTAVTVVRNPQPNVITTNPSAVCTPATVDLTLPAVTAGSTPGLTLNYFTDAGATTYIADSSLANAGTYYIVGVDGLGCSDTTSVIVTVDVKPTVVTTNPPPICSSASLDLTLPAVTAGSTAGLTFNYFTDPGATTHVADSSVVMSSGTYYIVGITPGGCSDTAAVTVSVNPKPIMVTNDPAAECSPNTVDLTLPAVTSGSTAGLTYTYFTDAGATMHIADSTSAGAGIFYIIGTIGTGCSDTASVSVTINPKPAVVITTPSPVCSPAIIDLTLPAVTSGSTPGITLNYYTDPGADTIMVDSSNVLLSGTYYIVGVLPSTGCSDTSAVFASVNATAVGGIVSADALVCSGANGDTLTLTSYSGTIQKWQYSVDEGVSWIDTANTTNKFFFSNITVTTWYRVKVTAFCASATSAEARITVDSTPLPVGGTVSPNLTVCSGSNHDTLTLSGSTGNIIRWEYSIDGGNTWVYVNNTTITQIFNNLTSTTIYHAILQNSVCGFATSSNDTVTVNPVSNAGIIIGAIPGCAFANGGLLTLGAYSGAILNWQYSDDAGTTWTDIANTSPSQAYSNLPDTTFYRTIVQSGVCPADTSTATMIIAYPKPLAMFTFDTACFGEATSFINSSTIASGFIQFNQWDFGDNTSSLSTNPTHIYSQAGTNMVSLITSSNFGCLDTALAGSVVVLPAPIANAGNDTTISLGSSIILNGQGGTSYSWSPANGLSNPNIYNPIANPLTTTTYELTAIDSKGCSGKDLLTITVIADYNVEVTNLLTANGDGFNDKWYVKNIENYPGTEAIVVNREGQQVFYSSSYDNSWDGLNKNGKPLPDGTYYYFLKFKDSNKLYKGPLTIFNEK